MKRYELFCRKLVRERHYDTAAFITSPGMTKGRAAYHQPADDLTLRVFAASFVAAMKVNVMVNQ